MLEIGIPGDSNFQTLRRPQPLARNWHSVCELLHLGVCWHLFAHAQYVSERERESGLGLLLTVLCVLVAEGVVVCLLLAAHRSPFLFVHQLRSQGVRSDRL